MPLLLDSNIKLQSVQRHPRPRIVPGVATKQRLCITKIGATCVGYVSLMDILKAKDLGVQQKPSAELWCYPEPAEDVKHK